MKSLLNTLKKKLQYVIQTPEERRHSLVGPANMWKMKRDFQIKFLKSMNLQPENYLLDIGCGTLRGGIPVISYLDKGHYFGIDIRETALDEARNELHDSGLENRIPTLLLSKDISQLKIDQKFNFIWAFSVLFHLNDQILNHTLDFVSKHLSDNGVFYANVSIGNSQEGQWEEFPVNSRLLSFYIDCCARYNLAVDDLGTLRQLGHVTNEDSHDSQTMLKITRSI